MSSSPTSKTQSRPPSSSANRTQPKKPTPQARSTQASQARQATTTPKPATTGSGAAQKPADAGNANGTQKSGPAPTTQGTTPKDGAQVSQAAKETAQESGANLSSMFKGVQDWADKGVEAAKKMVPKEVQEAMGGAWDKGVEIAGKVQEGLKTGQQLADLVGGLKKDGLTPQNMDKLNSVLARIDSPEAAQKLFKEHPEFAEALRGLGGDKLNQLFNQTGQNMRDCQTVYNILGKDKLGGEDGRVTTGDSWAISNGAMQDPSFRNMAKWAAISQLQKDGRRFAARFAANHPRLADRVVQRRGPGEMASRLNESLGTLGLNGRQENNHRNLSYQELNAAAQAGQRLMGNQNPQTLNQMVQQGVWCPQPTPTMQGVQNQARQQAQQAMQGRPLGDSDFVQGALEGTIRSIPDWANGNHQEGVRKYWEANGHVHNLLLGLGVDGR